MRLVHQFTKGTTAQEILVSGSLIFLLWTMNCIWRIHCIEEYITDELPLGVKETGDISPL